MINWEKIKETVFPSVLIIGVFAILMTLILAGAKVVPDPTCGLIDRISGSVADFMNKPVGEMKTGVLLIILYIVTLFCCKS